MGDGGAAPDHRSIGDVKRGEQAGGVMVFVTPTSAQRTLGRPGRYADASENFLLGMGWCF